MTRGFKCDHSHNLFDFEFRAVSNQYVINEAELFTPQGYRARGGGGAGGALAPHFFENNKELLRKKSFQPPHFESLVSPPLSK